ncbi:hypothetical protein ACFOTA_18675 [Chitinophaga sp. GCM10012297]|uniref:Uncharacterized protein n=1 Tax=Chitinophaga chungangae TaxID=2821488 RepID=A0ABS3YHT0_9BACT|nr:hypothetical protein [Chitinophaga chungangae]MBO9154247.1 hypothetical protein [Chitinophaga chungangae]
MRFVLALILTVILGYILGLFLDWWSISLAAFIVAFFWQQSPARAFGSGFLAVFLLWGTLALVIDVRNEHILSSRMSELILKAGLPMVMILITGVIGGLVGGVSALSASVLRPARKSK